ncbi:MAG: hypothetical protein GY936_18255, partial [Ignavibacteriae bacterium]|nr:hypothetical protein [Ignavibacteriota bacterium]
ATSSFANGLSLNSVGTKALGMGGAFVGLANDATAIYWNPAGFAAQKSSVDLFFTGIMPSGSYQMDAAGIDATLKSNLYPTGGLLGVYNSKKLTFGLGIYVPAGLGAEWNPEDVGQTANLELLSQIGVVNISPAVAYQVNEKFSIGLAVNISYAMFDLKQDGGGVQFEEESTGLGFGATLGLQYKFSEKFQAGAAVRLATTVSMTGTAKNPMFTNFGFVSESDFDRDVTWPMWIAGGFAYSPSKCLTLTFDAQYSQWSELDKLVATYDDANWQGTLSGLGQDEFELDWEDAMQIRLGGEYLVSSSTAIRLGYYYDPAPAPDETLVILFPSSTNHVVTAGLGHSFGKYRVDAAVEYLLGADREIELNAVNAQPGTHHLDVFAFSLGFSVGL